jgi:hypothetical protein
VCLQRHRCGIGPNDHLTAEIIPAVPEPQGTAGHGRRAIGVAFVKHPIGAQFELIGEVGRHLVCEGQFQRCPGVVVYQDLLGETRPVDGLRPEYAVRGRGAARHRFGQHRLAQVRAGIATQQARRHAVDREPPQRQESGVGGEQAECVG